jgi:hypothetical protein
LIDKNNDSGGSLRNSTPAPWAPATQKSKRFEI